MEMMGVEQVLHPRFHLDLDDGISLNSASIVGGPRESSPGFLDEGLASLRPKVTPLIGW
jgi:hypothetical protein